MLTDLMTRRVEKGAGFNGMRVDTSPHKNTEPLHLEGVLLSAPTRTRTWNPLIKSQL